MDYKTQYSFKDLIGTSAPLRFDFAVFKNDKIYFLIECQGQQHYTPNKLMGGEEQYKQRVSYDNKKREYCKKHNYPLIEIPYTLYSKIDQELIIKLISQII